MITTDIYNPNLKVSDYQPSKEVEKMTVIVRDDYQYGVDVLNREWTELGGMSVLARDERDSKTFNAFVDESIEDPTDAWKWRGTRSKARNKAIAMHSQITAGYVVPLFMAQNDDDEEDREFSDVMRDIVEWMVDNSDYKSSFANVAMGMLVHPIAYLGAEYNLVFQTIKEKTDKGYSSTEIIDEVLSGFNTPVYTCDQILITNPHIQNEQRQRGIIKRRWIEYSEAEALYGHHENWKYVKPGWQTVFSSEAGCFYDTFDENHPSMVEEVTAMYRREDLEIPYVGGIYMGDDDVESNPMRHRDNKNAPKYNITPFGYQRINEHFWFYKSLMNAQYYDNQLLDAQYEIGMNRLFLETEMPIAISGTDKVDKDIVFPGAVTGFAEKDIKVQKILPDSNISEMFAGMNMVERSMEESSVSGLTAGQAPAPDTKATVAMIAQRNAETLLKGVGRSLAESMVKFGSLMSDIAVNHLTVPQIMELEGEGEKMKYPAFVLSNRPVNGRGVSKIIRFDESLLGREMTEPEKNDRAVSLAIEAGYPNETKSIREINPERFSRMKYLTRIEPAIMFPKNEEFTQAMWSQLYSQFANNPYISLEALTRRTAYQFLRGDAEEIMQKPAQGTVDGNGQPLSADGGTDVGGSQAGNQAVNNALSRGIKGVV